MKKVFLLSLLVAAFASGTYYLKNLNQGVLPDTKRSLEQEGVIVQRTGLVLATDCRVSSVAQCNNFANTDAIYLGGMVPCNENGLLALCNEANDRPIPLIKKALSWQLGLNEAVVMYGPMPPTKTYFSIELMLYERHKDNLADLANYIPPSKGESLPPATMAERYVIDASVGDSFNSRVLRTGPLIDHVENSEGGGDLEQKAEENFALVISGNAIVMEQVINELQQNGFPESGINRLPLPESYVFGLDELADTFRLVGRIGRPFDEKEMKGFLRESLFQFKLWRITFDTETTAIETYAVPDCTQLKNTKGVLPAPCHQERATGRAELDPEQSRAFEQFKTSVKEQFGKPSSTLQPLYRRYDDEFCIESGTYCWGNNNDATYVNINDPATDSIAIFDLSSPTSKVVFAGIDHQKAGWADMWNLGFFEPSGATLGSVNFADIQENYVSTIKPDVAGIAFYMQLKEHCETVDKNCYSINFKEGAAKKIALVNRIYLSPHTSTGPDGAQTAMPVIYVYE